MTAPPSTTRPTKRAGGGALIRDRSGRVLLVRPSYKPGWEIPGGVVELDESPRQCCAREVLEELGLVVPIGRLLVVDWLPALGPKTEGLLFVFDGGTFDDRRLAAIRLQSEELLEWKLVEVPELPEHLAPGMARRMAAAVAMADSGGTSYLEWGNAVDPAPPTTVRAATPDDAAVAAAVHLASALRAYRDIFPPEAGPPTLDALAADMTARIDDDTHTVLVAERHGALVGVVIAGADEGDPDAGLLSRLYVHPGCWGQGVGRLLYEGAVAALADAEYPKAALWVLEANTRARAMYERWGWTLVPGVTKPTWEDIVDVRYELPLSRA